MQPTHFLLFLMVAYSLFCCNRRKEISVSPNILLIMTDDMGYGDVSSANNPHLNTPALDQLAKMGTRFSQFYVSPVCAPTRASLLTGRYHQRTGVRSVTNGYEVMHPDELTLAELLKSNGYQTAIFGKWHLGEYYPSLPNAQGFDEYLGFRSGHTDLYFDPVLEHNGDTMPNQGYITDVLTQKVLEFMTGNNNAPFFCYLAYNAPHTPLQIDSNLVAPFLKSGLEERTARVYAMIQNLDSNVGKIIKTLEEKQLLEETIIVFLSDNGPISGWRLPQEKMRYNAGLRDQKFSVYEGGIRTQCYWMWKNHWPEDREIQEVAGHIDVLPTLMDALHFALPANHSLDGLSLLPLLAKQQDSLSERIFFQKFALETLETPAPFPGGMARKGHWKMVNGSELYDLSQDPGERTNLAKDHPELLSNLTSAYIKWYQEVMAENQHKESIIGIGHKQENPVYLQPHHGKAKGGLKFIGKRGLEGEITGTHPTGVDGDWISNWKMPGDAITWQVKVVESGRYKISALLRGQSSQKPVWLQLKMGGASMETRLQPEQISKEWQETPFGTIALEKGTYEASVNLPEALEETTLEIRALLAYRLPSQ